MALTPVDEAHALQIQAGAVGRKAGHAFEDAICSEINSLDFPQSVAAQPSGHLFVGDPALLLLRYVARCLGYSRIQAATALSTGALATSEAGRTWLSINGSSISRCKSDIVVTLSADGTKKRTVGISTKQCNNATPTNAQLYFTTARGFAKLLRDNAIHVSDAAVVSLRRFCGDAGFRPQDDPAAMKARRIDPRRFFWEELAERERGEWEDLFSTRQDEITRLLLQKAYLDDPFVPDFLLHKTKRSQSWLTTEVAIFGVEELVRVSRLYQGFATRPYVVRKGSYPDPPGVEHLAPRFGVVQMQRGGQAQHPEQLQFNLEAGYFYKLDKNLP